MLPLPSPNLNFERAQGLYICIRPQARHSIVDPRCASPAHDCRPMSLSFMPCSSRTRLLPGSQQAEDGPHRGVYQDNPRKFACVPEHFVCFQGKKQENVEKITSSNFGGNCNPERFVGEPFMIAWHVRWTVKGLMPVRPCVLLSAAVTLPAGRAIMVPKP